jgi:hypothetical protein
MGVSTLLTFIGILLGTSESVQITSERRVHHHKHHHSPHEQPAMPLLSLSELLAKSDDLTKAFQRNAEALREQVKQTEDPDADSQVASFLETASGKKADKPIGLQAMESVTDKIMAFTDRMRKMGNEAALFSG